MHRDAKVHHTPNPAGLVARLSHVSHGDPAWCDGLMKAVNIYEGAPAERLWTEIVNVIKDDTAIDAEENVARWMAQKCSPAMWNRVIQVAPFPSCLGATGSTILSTPACVGLRTCTNPLNAPHIAIVLGATSKKVQDPSTDNMALFTAALPSIAKTVECGFRYSIFLGYDAGDAFYDEPAGQESIMAWFDQHVRQPLQKGGIDIDLVPVRVDNPTSKPGPVFNAAARQARGVGADFFYRINDDTLLLTPWAGAFACTVCSLGPPYGVVGPVESVRSDILTHDFVHAMHLDIFDDYYPTQLTDWYLDDWISKVYGPLRSYRLAQVKVRHRTPEAHNVTSYSRLSHISLASLH